MPYRDSYRCEHTEYSRKSAGHSRQALRSHSAFRGSVGRGLRNRAAERARCSRKSRRSASVAVTSSLENPAGIRRAHRAVAGQTSDFRALRPGHSELFEFHVLRPGHSELIEGSDRLATLRSFFSIPDLDLGDIGAGKS